MWEYSTSDKKQTDRRASYFYWTCLILSGLLWGWLGFWLHLNQIGGQTHPALAIPGGVMLFLFVMLVGSHFSESLPSKWKIITGCLIMIVSVVITDPVKMITYDKNSNQSMDPTEYGG